MSAPLCLLVRTRPASSRLDSLLSSKVLGKGSLGAGFCTEMGSRFVPDSGNIKTSACKTFSSRKFRIKDSMIPSSSWTVLKILQASGFRSYLVGGCVRDLILHRVPKDFDVVATATLEEIKEKFHRCCIIGKRFPIYRVLIKDLFVEVSSFETVALNTENREEFLSANMPVLKDGANIILWRNSLSRDFTVNRLVTCDRLCDCNLWVSLMAFHLAVVNHPQNAFVIWTVASVLYYGQWKEGVQFAIGHAGQPIDFVPEIAGSSSFGTAELAERVNKLASLAQEYAAILSDEDSMLEYPNIPSSGMVIIPSQEGCTRCGGNFPASGE